jgi:hypothetical protein
MGRGDFLSNPPLPSQGQASAGIRPSSPVQPGIQTKNTALDSRLPDCAATGKTSHNAVFVIPGLTRARSEALALSSFF